MRKSFWFVLLLLLLCVPQLSFAAERTYQVTETELTRLEQNLTQLSEMNSSQSMTLEQQKIQLQNSDLQLKQAEEKYSLLSSQMKNLEREMLEQQDSLETARKSFEQFAKEEQLKKDKLKREKNIGYWLAGILAVVCIAR